MEKEQEGAANAVPTESPQTPVPLEQAAFSAGTWPKVRKEAPGTGHLYRALRHQGSGQGFGMGSLLTSTQDLAVLTPCWRARRPIELNESGEWRYLTTLPGQTVENLQERINQMSIEGMGQVCRFEPPRVILNQPTLLFPPYAFFLNQVWAHLDDHAPDYTSNQAMVRMVTANLEGEAAEWVTQLYDEGAPELGNINTFLQELRARFEDDSQTLKSKIEI